MLVLTRRIDESIVIDNNKQIEVKVLSVTGKQVKLGINAPDNVAIHREEIFAHEARNPGGKTND